MREKIEKAMFRKYINMFTNQFIQNHSSFESFEQLWKNDKNRLKEKLSFFDYIKTEEWDEYIKEETDFDNFVGMEFAAKINDFKTNGRHWFSNE